jgi:hypothetical protein
MDAADDEDNFFVTLFDDTPFDEYQGAPMGRV